MPPVDGDDRGAPVVEAERALESPPVRGTTVFVCVSHSSPISAGTLGSPPRRRPRARPLSRRRPASASEKRGRTPRRLAPRTLVRRYERTAALPLLRGGPRSSDLLRAAAQHAALPVRRSPCRLSGGRLGRLAEVSEHALDGLRLGDDGEELHPPLAPRALEDVDAKRALQKLGPRTVAAATSLWARRRRRVEVVGGRRGHAALGHDARAELACRGEHARVADGV